MTHTKLKNWRLRMGFTQLQAARALGRSASQYKNWERGTAMATGRPCAIPDYAANRTKLLWRQRKEFIAHEDVFLYPGEDWKSRVCKEL
jgi:transcriptional regulator with XRE-family HTH domain